MLKDVAGVRNMLVVINSVAVFCAVVSSLALWQFDWKYYPSAKRLKAAATNGVIHHPLFGDYPVEVEFKQGMDLYPGQTASARIRMRVAPEKKQ